MFAKLWLDIFLRKRVLLRAPFPSEGVSDIFVRFWPPNLLFDHQFAIIFEFPLLLQPQEAAMRPSNALRARRVASLPAAGPLIGRGGDVKRLQLLT